MATCSILTSRTTTDADAQSAPPRGIHRRGVSRASALSIRQVAERLGVSASTFQRLVAGKSRVSPDMALRLSRVLGRSAESWLVMQDSHDLWQARQRLDLSGLTLMELTTA